MDIHAKAYKEEAYEILAELESLLLELAENHDDPELIDRVFGSFHTIKGSGSMFGFDAIAEFTHEVETALDHVRDGTMSVTQELVSLTLEARDKILELLDQETNTLDAEGRKIISAFQELINSEQMLKDKPDPAEEPLRSTVTFRIRFKPDEDIFTTGTNPLLLLGELQEMGDCSIVAKSEGIPELDDYNPEKCYVAWDIVLTTRCDEKEVRDVFIFVEDKCNLTIEPVFEHIEAENCEEYKRLGEILLDRGDLTKDQLARILSGRKKLGEQLVESKAIDPTTIDAALTEQNHIRKVLRQEREKTLSSIRVDSGRLDTLVDLVGELVTVQARLTQKVSREMDPEFQLIAESVERLTNELRDNAMSIRMVPIGTIFSRFRRLIHDLAEGLGKQIRMTTEGSATELDKTVIDQLNDPLVHIIRNAVDHGIEPARERQALGKPDKGTVHLAAHHAGASVFIEITDDGAGLDAEVLKAKAVDKGLIKADAELSEQECFNLIFHPGLSTAEEITGVSGRGVGMDVVKRSIDNLRGTIEITSARGVGTTISLRLPLTLAIIDGLLVRVGEDLFIIPLSVIEECVEMTSEQAGISRERSMMTFRGEAFTYISLRHIFGIAGDPPDIEKVILVKVRGKRTGFGVDQVIGQHQTVIKTLSRVYGNVEGISGATILGDGTVALILDVSQLVTAGRNEEKKLNILK
jgi:two-component system chemotaxis sensor kinase CheA